MFAFLSLVSMSILANDKVRIETSISYPWISYSSRFHIVSIWHHHSLGAQIEKHRTWLLCLPYPTSFLQFTSKLCQFCLQNASQVHLLWSVSTRAPESRPPSSTAPDTFTVRSCAHPTSPAIYLHVDVYVLLKIWIGSCPSLIKYSSSYIWCHFPALLLISIHGRRGHALPHLGPITLASILSPHSSCGCHHLKKPTEPAVYILPLLGLSLKVLDQWLAYSKHSVNDSSCFCFDHCCSSKYSKFARLGD